MNIHNEDARGFVLKIRKQEVKKEWFNKQGEEARKKRNLAWIKWKKRKISEAWEKYKRGRIEYS